MRPIFTVHAGEFLAGQYIERECKKNVWVPGKDTGIDLLVTNQGNTKAVGFQVKFSKDFLSIMNLPESVLRGLRSRAWFSLDRNKMRDSTADLWVFVLAAFTKRSQDYVLIKPSELVKKLDALGGTGEKPIQTYIVVTEHKRPRCWLTRGLLNADHEAISNNTYENEDRELTAYLNDWSLIASL
jgi:hypothetical protein